MKLINFNDLQHKKGRIGEKYIALKLVELGYNVCELNGEVEQFYRVDLEISKNGQKFWVQIKYKEPRRNYPDTGMELSQYRKLIEYQKDFSRKVLILFTDNSKRIYGEWVDNLYKCISPYWGTFNKVDNCEMIYWLTDKLKDYRKLLAHNRLIDRRARLKR